MSSWTQTSPGIWRRELGGLETTYQFLSRVFERTGKEHWGLYAICAVKFENCIDPATVLRLAWKALRWEFPGLGVVVKSDGDGNGYQATYRVATPETLELWAEETFLIEQHGDADAIIAEYPLRDLPALIYLQATSEILLLASHWRVDGIGCCLLLNRLLALVAEPPDMAALPWGWEHDLGRMSPSLEDAAGAPYETDPDIEATTKRVTSEFQQRARDSTGLTYNGDSTLLPGETTSQSMVFTSESSRDLMQACKSRQVSLSAAVYAALGQSMLTLRDRGHGSDARSEDDIAEFSTIMAVNMRPYLQPPFHTEAHACQAYVSSITPTVRRQDSFGQSAVDLTKYFKTWHTSDYNKALRQIYQHASNALLQRAASRPSKPPPSGVTLSSMGIIDKILAEKYDGESASVSVQGFRFGVSMLTRQVLLYLWTFKGQVHLSVNYNVVFYGVSTLRGLLDQVRSTLENELEVVLQSVEE